MKRLALIFPLVALLVATAPARPASLDIVADCGAVPDDGLDDTAAIRSCLAQQPRELVIPAGVFDVDRQPGDSSDWSVLNIDIGDTVVRGQGPSSVVHLLRDENGFSQARIFGINAETFDVERVTIRDLTIDGGRGSYTCLDVKHTPGSSPGDGKGQQQFGIFLRGQGAFVRDVSVERVNFVGLSGDAIFLYQSVEDVRVVGQTIGGYCRSGVTINSYGPHCDEDSTQGVRRILIDRNTFNADPTATQGARAIDIEPNTAVCDITITRNFLDDIETGHVTRLRIEDNTVDDIGSQLGGSIVVVDAHDFSVRRNIVRSKDMLTAPIYVLKSHLGVVAENVIEQKFAVAGVEVSNNGVAPSSDIVVDENRINYIGEGVAVTYGIRTQGVLGRLDVTNNVILGAWRRAIHIHGCEDCRVSDNAWDVPDAAIWVRSNAGGFLETKTLTVTENRGKAAYVFRAFGPVGALRDCGNSSTGGRTIGGNTLLPCSTTEDETKAALDDHEARLQALESGQ